MRLLGLYLALAAASLCCSGVGATSHGRPLVGAALIERPVLYNTTTYGILELDFIIEVEYGKPSLR